jgi:hypothetical protein
MSLISCLLTFSNINILCKDINKTDFKYQESKDGLLPRAPKIRITNPAEALKSFISFWLRGREWNFSPSRAAFGFVPALDKSRSHSIRWHYYRAARLPFRVFNWMPGQTWRPQLKDRGYDNALSVCGYPTFRGEGGYERWVCITGKK